MDINNYYPTFRNVLIEKKRPERTKSGLFIPEIDFKVFTHSTMFENEKVHEMTDALTELVVVKTGKDCSTIQEGDIVILMEGIRPQVINLSDGDYIQVMEQQVIGYERKQAS